MLPDTSEFPNTKPTAFTNRHERLTRIFQIGFNKCGTRSLYRFMQKSNIHAAHFNRGKLAFFIARNIEYGRKPLYGINRYIGYTDVQSITRDGVIEGAHYYRELYQYYPNSYFILNTRDRDGWIKSRLKHGGGNYAERYRKGLNLENEEAVINHWINDWDTHHREVPKFFADKPGRLLVYDIKNDNPEKIVSFLNPDFNTKVEHFGHEGDTANVDGKSYLTNKPVVR